MRTKYILKNLRKALQQDYLYDAKELKFMRDQLLVLEEEVKRTKPQGFGK
jgi:hypothetical protein